MGLTSKERIFQALSIDVKFITVPLQKVVQIGPSKFTMIFFDFFFFKAHFLPLPIELERWFLHQKKGHGKPFLAYEIQFSISTINSIAGALKNCDKCNFQKRI